MQDVERAPFVNVVHLVGAERRVLVHELEDLVFDHANVGTEIIVAETVFDEFLLFHEEFIRAIVDHIFAKDGSR